MKLRLLVLTVLLIAFVIPNAAFAKVGKEQRDLVIVTHLDLGQSDAKGKKAWDVVYAFIEKSGVAQTKLHLKRHYRKVHVIQTKKRDKKKTATAKAVANLLKKVTKRKKTKAVDMIWMTHGLPGGKVDLQHPKEDKNFRLPIHKTDKRDGLATKIRNAVGPEGQAKLRMLYSTACFGKSALKGWLEAGFKVASGSRGVFTDSAASHPKFLKSWKKGESFKKGVKAANKNQKRDFWDKTTKKLKKFKTSNVDSFREIRGAHCLTIDSNPSKACKKKKAKKAKKSKAKKGKK